jgi:hypothetical protein
MTKLEPLEQFVCDTCGKVIQASREGWLEWIDDRGSVPPSTVRKVHSFRICHHRPHSPLGGENGCYKHTDEAGRCDNHLNHILEHRVAELLWFVDEGKYHDPRYSGPSVSDFREWAELVRRLTIPYYEQARLYWKQAEDDGFFDGYNEIKIFTPIVLMGVIEKYAPRAE